VTDTPDDLLAMFKTMSSAKRESAKLPSAVEEIIGAIAKEQSPEELLRTLDEYRKGLATL
jgi:hypothetical protein